MLLRGAFKRFRRASKALLCIRKRVDAVRHFVLKSSFDLFRSRLESMNSIRIDARLQLRSNLFRTDRLSRFALDFWLLGTVEAKRKKCEQAAEARILRRVRVAGVLRSWARKAKIRAGRRKVDDIVHGCWRRNLEVRVVHWWKDWSGVKREKKRRQLYAESIFKEELMRQALAEILQAEWDRVSLVGNLGGY